MSIKDIIKSIKLLSGHHNDTAQTGSGCFMNVVAYLNGDDQITDNSPCVCFTVRGIAIALNDTLNGSERKKMIPFIERAMGSATDDIGVISMRVNLIASFAKDMADIAKKCASHPAELPKSSKSVANKSYAKCVAECAADSAINAKKYAKSANKLGAEEAVANAELCRSYTETTIALAAKLAETPYKFKEDHRHLLVGLMFKFLDEALPLSTTYDQCVIDRAQTLCDLAAA